MNISEYVRVKKKKNDQKITTQRKSKTKSMLSFEFCPRNHPTCYLIMGVVIGNSKHLQDGGYVMFMEYKKVQILSWHEDLKIFLMLLLFASHQNIVYVKR